MVIFALVGVSLLSLVGGFLAGTFIKSPADVAAQTEPPPYTLLTATVEEGTVAETMTVPATVALGDRADFTPPNPAGRDPVVTNVPVEVGSTVSPGSVLVEVADRPLILLSGDIPLVRDLVRGDRGPDVTRLQQALRDAGQVITDQDGYLGYSTAKAVSTLYAVAGYKAPAVEFGDVVAVKGELAFAHGGSGTVVAVAALKGHLVDGPAVSITTSAPIVLAELSQEDAARLSVGTPATVVGDFSEGTLSGAVSRIGELAESDDGGLRVPIDISVEENLASEAVDKGVQVTLDLAGAAGVADPNDETTTAGLVVPLSALHANAAGNTSVIVVYGDEQVRVTVTVLQTGDGRALISDASDTLAPGDEVLIGSTS